MGVDGRRTAAGILAAAAGIAALLAGCGGDGGEGVRFEGNVAEVTLPAGEGQARGTPPPRGLARIRGWLVPAANA